VHSRDLQKGTEYLVVVSLTTLTNEASSLTGSASFSDHVITVSILGGVSHAFWPFIPAVVRFHFYVVNVKRSSSPLLVIGHALHLSRPGAPAADYHEFRSRLRK
jgi:hypothetical protein